MELSVDPGAEADTPDGLDVPGPRAISEPIEGMDDARLFLRRDRRDRRLRNGSFGVGARGAGEGEDGRQGGGAPTGRRPWVLLHG
jgi:hypothetical protein